MRRRTARIGIVMVLGLLVVAGCKPQPGGQAISATPAGATTGLSPATEAPANPPPAPEPTAPPTAGTTPSTAAPAPPATTATTAPAPAGSVIAGDRIGFAQAYLPLWESDADLAREFDLIRASGARWVRYDFDWGAVEPSKGSYNWQLIDRGVNAAHARGLQVLGLVTYTPAWARPAGTSDHAPPTNPADYANFLRAAVTRYAPMGVHAWEIWNEPNSGDFWSPTPNVAAYTALLRQAYAAAHAADPTATVVTGGLAPAGGTLDYSDATHVSPWRFLKGIYEHGGQGSFDAVGHHPYPGMPYSPSTAAEWNPFQQTTKLYELMSANGDSAKTIWGTEAGSWTGSSDRSVSEAQQSAFVTEFLRGWASWTYTGPFFYYSLRDLGTNAADREHNFGLVRSDFSAKPALATFNANVSGP